jgi:hypothetical protein
MLPSNFHLLLEQAISQGLPAEGLTTPQAQQLVAMGLGDLPSDWFAPVQAHRWPIAAPNAIVQPIMHKLRDFLPGHIMALLLELQSIANRLEVAAYVIGGLPRDLMLATDRSLDIQDVDITVEAFAPDLVPQWLALSQNFTCQAIYPEYGTVTLQYKDTVQVDIASTRQERYHSLGAMPTIDALKVPLAADLLRRDFTINTLALSLNQLGNLYDVLGQGLADLTAKRLSVLTPISFFEDPTRLIRATRFMAQFGMRLDTPSQWLANQWWHVAPLRYKGGGERVTAELRRLLQSWVDQQDPKTIPTQAIETAIEMAVFGLMDTRLVPIAHPDTDRFVARYHRLHQAYERIYHWLDPEVCRDVLFQIGLCWLTPYMGNVDSTLERLQLDKALRQPVQKYAQYQQTPAHNSEASLDWPSLAHWSDATLYERLKPLPLCVIMAFWLDVEDEAFDVNTLERIRHYWVTLRPARSLLDGDTLNQLGVPQGEMVGRIKHNLIVAQIRGQVTDMDTAIAFVQQIIDPHYSS